MKIIRVRFTHVCCLNYQRRLILQFNFHICANTSNGTKQNETEHAHTNWITSDSEALQESERSDYQNGNIRTLYTGYRSDRPIPQCLLFYYFGVWSMRCALQRQTTSMSFSNKSMRQFHLFAFGVFLFSKAINNNNNKKVNTKTQQEHCYQRMCQRRKCSGKRIITLENLRTLSTLA